MVPLFNASHNLTHAGPDRYPAPLPLNTPPNNPQATPNFTTTPNPLPNARRQPAHKRSPNLALVFRAQKGLPRYRLQRRNLPRRPRGPRQTASEPYDRPGSDGGHDGHDEGERSHDGAAEFDHGLDQRFLLGLCHQCAGYHELLGQWLTNDSETTLPAHAAVQVYAAIWCWNKRFGRQMGQ